MLFIHIVTTSWHIHTDTFEAPTRPVEKPFRCSVADIFKGICYAYEIFILMFT